MDNENETGTENEQKAAFLIERLVAEGSVPAYLESEFQGKRDLAGFVNEFIAYFEQVYIMLEGEDGFDLYPDDAIKYIAEASGYPSDIIETVLWFDECYGMANGNHTVMGKCPECGHDELFIREGPDGMYSQFIQCGKCAKEYDFEEFDNYTYPYGVNLDEKLPMTTRKIIPLKNVSEVNSSYILKAATGYRKGIWRKIRISAAATLDDLSGAILDAFDFDDDHLYAFYMDEKLRTRGVPTFYSPRCGYSYESADGHMLENFNLTPKQKFLFLYDFGDEWHFTVTVEKIIDEITLEPIIVDSRGDAPSQYRSFDD